MADFSNCSSPSKWHEPEYNNSYPSGPIPAIKLLAYSSARWTGLFQFRYQTITKRCRNHVRMNIVRDRLQIILYKALALVHNDVIKNFIGSFEKLSDIKPHNY